MFLDPSQNFSFKHHFFGVLDGLRVVKIMQNPAVVKIMQNPGVVKIMQNVLTCHILEAFYVSNNFLSGLNFSFP